MNTGSITNKLYVTKLFITGVAQLLIERNRKRDMFSVSQYEMHITISKPDFFSLVHQISDHVFHTIFL